jgi:hypothetical protein
MTAEEIAENKKWIEVRVGGVERAFAAGPKGKEYPID